MALARGSQPLFSSLVVHGANYRVSAAGGGAGLRTLAGAAEGIGMFRPHQFPLPARLASAGCGLSIRVAPPDFPGDGRQGGQGGDHQIAKTACTSQFVGGWDWVRPT